MCKKRVNGSENVSKKKKNLNKRCHIPSQLNYCDVIQCNIQQTFFYDNKILKSKEDCRSKSKQNFDCNFDHP